MGYMKLTTDDLKVLKKLGKSIKSMEGEIIMKIKKATSFNAPTSFHHGSIEGTFSELVDLFGEPSFYNEEDPEKVSCEWELSLITDDDVVVDFRVYDWKQYDNYPVHNKDEIYSFHIGTKTKAESDKVVTEIKKQLGGTSNE